MFEDKNGDNTVTNDEVIQRYYYYPFGAETKNAPWTQQPTPKIRYQYNGKEKIDELGLGWNDYGARNYDALLGRWMGVDALAEKYVGYSSYNYVLGNPISLIDPDGRSVIVGNIYEENKDCNYAYPKMINAFEGFAKSKEGIAFLSDFARKGQTIAGHTYEKDGKYHKKNINLRYDAVTVNELGSTTRSGETEIVIGSKYIDITVQVDRAQFREDYVLGTTIHESLIHAKYFADDVYTDRKKDYSNLDPWIIARKNEMVENEYHHNNINLIRTNEEQFYKKGISILKEYYKSKNEVRNTDYAKDVIRDGM